MSRHFQNRRASFSKSLLSSKKGLSQPRLGLQSCDELLVLVGKAVHALYTTPVEKGPIWRCRVRYEQRSTDQFSHSRFLWGCTRNTQEWETPPSVAWHKTVSAPKNLQSQWRRGAQAVGKACNTQPANNGMAENIMVSLCILERGWRSLFKEEKEKRRE